MELMQTTTPTTTKKVSLVRLEKRNRKAATAPVPNPEPKAKAPRTRKAKVTATAPTPEPTKTRTSTMTREQWLEKAVRAMDTAILKPAGYQMPELWKVTCGFAKGSAKAIGQCWSPQRAADGKTTHMMVCPSLDEPVRVLDIVLHEMGHAVVGCDVGHKKPFRDYIKAVGLGGKKVTATVAEPGSPLHDKLVKIAAKLGDYPHQALRPTTSTKKAAGGWLRLVSVNDDSYKVVISPKSLDEHGYPLDPWGSAMELVN